MIETMDLNMIKLKGVIFIINLTLASFNKLLIKIEKQK